MVGLVRNPLHMANANNKTRWQGIKYENRLHTNATIVFWPQLQQVSGQQHAHIDPRYTVSPVNNKIHCVSSTSVSNVHTTTFEIF